MKNLDDGPDGLNDAAFDRALRGGATRIRIPASMTRTVRENFGGQRCVFDVLAEVRDPRRGLIRLCRDKLGTVTTYYIRWGVDDQGCAKGGAQLYRRAQPALKAWSEVVASIPPEVAALTALLHAKRAELATVAPPGSAWGGIPHDRHRADEISSEIRGIELRLASIHH